MIFDWFDLREALLSFDVLERYWGIWLERVSILCGIKVR